MMKQPSLYDQDFYGWVQQQARALEQHQASALDWQHLQEEIESLGRQEYQELVNRLGILIGHLLKWEYQADQQTRSWFLSVREQRRAILRHLRDSPSLKARLEDAVADGYEIGVDLALRETMLPLQTFPDTCPYGFNRLMEDQFLCDTSQDWVG